MVILQDKMYTPPDLGRLLSAVKEDEQHSVTPMAALHAYTCITGNLLYQIRVSGDDATCMFRYPCPYKDDARRAGILGNERPSCLYGKIRTVVDDFLERRI